MFRLVPRKLPQCALPYPTPVFVRPVPGPLAKPRPARQHHTTHLDLRKGSDLHLRKTFRCAKASVGATDCARSSLRFPLPNPASHGSHPSSNPCRPENAAQQPRESAAALASQIHTSRGGSELNVPLARPVGRENPESRGSFRGPLQRR